MASAPDIRPAHSTSHPSIEWRSPPAEGTISLCRKINPQARKENACGQVYRAGCPLVKLHRRGDRTQRHRSQQPAPPVAVQAATTGDIASYYNATATLDTEMAAEILARVEGVIQSLQCEEGYLVEVQIVIFGRHKGDQTHARGILSAQGSSCGLPW